MDLTKCFNFLLVYLMIMSGMLRSITRWLTRLHECVHVYEWMGVSVCDFEFFSVYVGLIYAAPRINNHATSQVYCQAQHMQ